MNDKDLQTLEMMERYGGSFVKSLAALAHHADPINLQKIKMTWGEYWDEYCDMAKKHYGKTGTNEISG